MLKYKSLVLTSLLAFSGIATAAMSSDITFEEHVANPGSVTEIELEKLYSGYLYTLTCMIKDNTNSNSLVNDASFYVVKETQYKPRLYIDDKSAEFHTAQSIKATGSKFVITHLAHSNASVAIQNLDFTDNLRIYDCVASIEHN